MNLIVFLIKCFLIGASAAAAVGPVFVLTFNRAALRGFLKGFFTALGAAIGDGVLLALGLVGALRFVQTSDKYHILIDFAGGFLLVLFGLSMIFFHEATPSDLRPKLTADTLIFAAAKTFLSTVLNPLTLFFFMFMGTRTLAPGLQHIAGCTIALASIMTGLGSLSVLSIVAYSAHRLGSAISAENLTTISIITGCIMLAIGSYFFLDAIKIWVG
jgi:threonine/homoserine/homoserine lactone efflux protein